MGEGITANKGKKFVCKLMILCIFVFLVLLLHFCIYNCIIMQNRLLGER